MKRFLWAIWVAVAGVAPALAADLPAHGWSKAPAADTAYNWGGWYVGGNAGGAWGRADTSSAFVNGTAPIANQQAAAAAAPRLDAGGFSGGGQLGYNHQIDRWLFGVEVDANYVGLSARNSVSGPLPVGSSRFTTTNSVTTDWLVTLRPRVGYVVDRTLFYATGGLALTDVKLSSSYVDGTGQNEAASLSKTRAGWTAGAGIEHAFTREWSAKVEYLYSDFGKQSTTGPLFTGPGPATGVIAHDTDFKTNTLRGGLNYHFGGPSVGRY
jgi:outer membrane immunogenic protein